MRSIKFPNMFNKTSTRVWKADEHKEATLQNTVLLLHTERGELFGDPYYGLLFKHYLFDQNNAILADILSDMIYTQLALFLPQIRIKREDISIIQDKKKGQVICSFSGVSQIDYTHNTFDLLLLNDQ